MRFASMTMAWAIVVSLHAAPVQAQTVWRAGFWGGVGAGIGAARLSCRICTGDREQGLSGYARFGVSIARGLRIGLEGNAWFHEENAVSRRLFNLGGVVFLYPRAEGGFFLKGGLGVSDYKASDDTDAITSRAFAAQIGAGYELRVTRRFALVPYANFIGSSAGDIRFNGDPSLESGNTSLIQLGIGTTWR